MIPCVNVALGLQCHAESYKDRRKRDWKLLYRAVSRLSFSKLHKGRFTYT